MAVTRAVLLRDEGDERGASFQLGTSWREFLGTVQDVHAMTIRPGAVRGNHYHEQKSEVFIVMYQDRWGLFWDDEYAGRPCSEQFEGSGTAMITMPPRCAHAIRNGGNADLIVLELANMDFNPACPDSVPRDVLQQF